MNGKSTCFFFFSESRRRLEKRQKECMEWSREGEGEPYLAVVFDGKASPVIRKRGRFFFRESGRFCRQTGWYRRNDELLSQYLGQELFIADGYFEFL